ncbi:DNA-processing protein DprA [Pseudidiomarina aestuarii]|uniref:DNA-processing protein DprA n=1 Tax=Pseudidiomarina aestuarii TaxID=624146 RepID=UPI003A97C6FC
MDAALLALLMTVSVSKKALQKRLRLLSTLAAVEAAVREVEPPPPAYQRHAQRWLAHEDHHLLHWWQPNYPESLRNIPDPPLVLYLHGDCELLEQPQVAVIGSRMASEAGLQAATLFAADLTRNGILVSSGLAGGIDGAAHKSALEYGNTLAVLGCGPDIVYPPKHRQLQQRIAQQGLLVSEFAPGVKIRSNHFPRRNRILSGLSRGVLVIEAKLRSGTLITARQGLEQNRSVMALPGSIWDASCSGNLKVIQEGAALVTSVDDILSELNIQRSVPTLLNMGENNSTGSLANLELLANVGNEVTPIDTIVARSGLPAAIVTEQLVLLELEGWVTSVSGGYMKMGRR